MSTEDSVLVISEAEEGITLIEFNRPRELNSLTREMVAEMHDILGRLAQDPSRRAVLLTGRGRGFCAGMDVKANKARYDGVPEVIPLRFRAQERFAGMVRAIRAVPCPVIAAVNGVCVGGGFALSLACDIRLANDTARFGVASVKIGLSAGESGISYHLPRLIGSSRAFELMLTGRMVGAEEAERIGLVSALVSGADLVPRALDVARMIKANSPYAIEHSKKVMWANVDANGLESALELENHVQILATQTEDFAEAMRAFVEKRPPRFQGR